MPPPNITLELPVARKCAFQRVNLCMLAIAKNISPGVEKVKHLAEKEGDLARDKYEDGEFVSTDKFILKTPGRLKYGYIRESSDGCFQCSTIYNNATSGLIWVESQVLLGGNKNVMVKSQSSKYLSYQATDEVFHYHCNNRLFMAEKYRRDCEHKGQSQIVLGVGYQHQNACTECAIQNIIYMQNKFMVHCSLHWTERGTDELSLWYFSEKHFMWMYNCLTNR